MARTAVVLLALDPSGLAGIPEGLKRPLKAGGDFDLILTFEKAGTVSGGVLAANAKSHGHAGHRH